MHWQSKNYKSNNFQAYAAGCDVVILSLTLKRVQIIPGDELVGCVDACEDCGRIAAAYSTYIKIYEPSRLMHHENSTEVGIITNFIMVLMNNCMSNYVSFMFYFNWLHK